MLNCNAIIAARVGSRMYGLDIEDSDYDYALFGLEPVENGNPYTQKTACNLLDKPARIDGVYRHVNKIGWMADYSCIYHLAYLFSKEVITAPEADGFWQELTAMREDIAAANLRRFRELCFVRLNATKSKASRQSYGTNNKALMTTILYCNVLKKFASGAPYEDCIRQDTETLLAVRRGEMPEIDALTLLDKSLRSLNTREVITFYQRPKNTEALNRIQTLIRDYFGDN